MVTILTDPAVLPSMLSLVLLLIGLLTTAAGLWKVRMIGHGQVEAAEQAAAITKAQREQAESQAAITAILDKVAHDTAEAKAGQAAMVATIAVVAQDTAETKMQQAVTGIKVDGQMTLLHATIAELRSDLAASKGETAIEKDKASTLAVQTAKDTAGQEARALAVERIPVTGGIPVGSGASRIEEGAAGLPGQVVIVPEQILPVEEAQAKPLIVAP